MAARNENFRRLLLTFQALSELGSEMTADTDFTQRARGILSSLLSAADTREGALFLFRDKPAVLASLASGGFSMFPDPAVIPLLPKHVHALTNLRGPVPVTRQSWDSYLTSNGNVAPELFKCIAPLRVGGKLVGLVGLGRRAGDEAYQPEDMEAVGLLSNYVALAVHNHALSETLAQRVSEHLKLLATVHNFYDNALETFAHAIDIKHIHTRGHSLRVGRYSVGIAEGLGLDPGQVAGVRAAGYLHDIGKVAVDKRLFGKVGKLDEQEMREMCDHTTVGHQIVQGVEFPWPQIPEAVRWHHERNDGTGYPDQIAAKELPEVSRIVAVADVFEAMTSERPYRHSMTVGEALSEVVRIAPLKFDINAVQALLIQVRRDAVGRPQGRFLDDRAICNIAPADIDLLASALNHKMTHGRIYSA
ncbi:MAG: HD-GYP domain-containing protein [Terriglobales bacterium]